MNAKMISRRSGVAALLASLVVACALWISAEGRAETPRAALGSVPVQESVQDKAEDVQLDLKIFLHRNGRVSHLSGPARHV